MMFQKYYHFNVHDSELCLVIDQNNMRLKPELRKNNFTQEILKST